MLWAFSKDFSHGSIVIYFYEMRNSISTTILLVRTLFLYRIMIFIKICNYNIQLIYISLSEMNIIL